MLMLIHGERLQALKQRERYITQAELDKRDEVLNVDYDNYDYDFILVNDYREETVNEAINIIQGALDSEQKQGESDSQERKRFLNQLSNNGEHRKLPSVVDLNGVKYSEIKDETAKIPTEK